MNQNIPPPTHSTIHCELIDIASPEQSGKKIQLPARTWRAGARKVAEKGTEKGRESSHGVVLPGGEKRHAAGTRTETSLRDNGTPRASINHRAIMQLETAGSRSFRKLRLPTNCLDHFSCLFSSTSPCLSPYLFSPSFHLSFLLHYNVYLGLAWSEGNVFLPRLLHVSDCSSTVSFQTMERNRSNCNMGHD